MRDISCPVVVLITCIAAELLAILLLNDRQFTFTLDDPYIHLALAENIARGHYGINLGEVSSPSSSMAWPFVLAPFASAPSAVYIIVVLNSAAAVGTLMVMHRVMAKAFAGWQWPGRRWFTALMGLALIVGTNLVGLVFTGMEHSLQVLLSAMAVLGLATEAERDHPPWWLPAALVAGPLVRYENLAITLPALAYLFVRGHRRSAVASVAAIVAFLGGFSWYLHHLGLPVLPASVSAKSDVVATGASVFTLVNGLYQSLVASPRGLLLAVGAMPLAAVAAGSRDRPRADRLLAATLVTAVGLHLCVGSYGWFSRYELYVWTALVLGLIVTFGPALARAASRAHPIATLEVAALSLLVTCAPYVYALVMTPIAANNIYEQNLQMRAFVTEFVRAPVAVNDIGLVSWRNPHYVLDLLGLASLEAQAHRRAGDASWVTPLMRRYDARVAIVHDQPWMLARLPDDWQLAGTMRLSRRPINVGDATVSYFSTDGETRARLAGLLDRFRKRVPAGVAIDVSTEPLRERGERPSVGRAPEC